MKNIGLIAYVSGRGHLYQLHDEQLLVKIDPQEPPEIIFRLD